MSTKKCPQCHTSNDSNATECSNCAVQFRDLARGRTEPRQTDRTGQTCAWNDHGRHCPSRGIFSTTTSGEGTWYCREHWERLNSREPGGLGNYPVSSPRSVTMRQWDGWHERWLARRDRKLPTPPIMREPGSDDEWSDLVPEEAGQP